MALTKEEFKAWAIAEGWTPDQYGHLQREWAPGEKGNQKPERYRYKITKIAVRLEIRVGRSLGAAAEWILRQAEHPT